MRAPRAPRTKKTATEKPVLAREGDPLVNAYGEVLPPALTTAQKEKLATLEREADRLSQPSMHIEKVTPETYRSQRKRSLSELPAPVATINAVSAVFMYTLLGVSDREIAEALNVTVPEIEAVRSHSAYGECFDHIMSEFINSNSELLTSRIAAYSQHALSSVGEIAMSGKKEENRLRASMDLLDRAGVRAKDAADRAAANKLNELRIVVVKDEATQTNINIQVDV